MKLRITVVLALLGCIFLARAQENVPDGLTLKKVEAVKTVYSSFLLAAPGTFEKAGFTVPAGGIDILADTKSLFSNDPKPYLSIRLQTATPAELSGDYSEQAKQVVRQNMMKIARAVTSSLGTLVTGGNIVGTCVTLSWGPGESSSNEVLVLLNGYGLDRFTSGSITLYDFIDRYAKLKHGSEQLTLR